MIRPRDRDEGRNGCLIRDPEHGGMTDIVLVAKCYTASLRFRLYPSSKKCLYN